MCRLLILVLFFYTGIIHAQQPVVLPGVFTQDVTVTSDVIPVSNAGNSIALRTEFYRYVLFDPQKKAILQHDRGMFRISSNHRYLFQPLQSVTRHPGNNRLMYGWQIKSAGMYTDTALRVLNTNHFPIDIDDKGIILAAEIWYDSTNSFWTGMKGLYKLDRNTGKRLQTINDDTIFVCRDRSGCTFQAFYLQKNYFAFAAKTYGESIDIFPLNGSKKIRIPGHNYHTAYADSSTVFTVGDSTLDFRKITAFDVRTGQQLAQTTISRPANYGQLFRSANNKLYILQTAAGMIEEWSVTKEGFTNTKTWNVGASMALAKDQSYAFFVLRGPSFFLIPTKMEKAEAGGFAANTAHFLNGPSNKISMQVFPFYNRTPDDVVKQKKATADHDAFVARYQAEKDSLAHPEKYCHHFWNTAKWRKGLTIFWGGGYQIMADYDCKNDRYKLWQPAQLYEGKGHYMTAGYHMVPGSQFRSGNYYSRQQYVTCTACEGDGRYERTVYTTTTKELPWGYFSGIETKKITTKSTTTTQSCSACMGNGVVLQ